jgi:hypothetical protein
LAERGLRQTNIEDAAAGTSVTSATIYFNCYYPGRNGISALQL